jgi:hypothetical protein
VANQLPVDHVLENPGGSFGVADPIDSILNPDDRLLSWNTEVSMLPRANPTTVSFNASLVRVYSAISSLMRLKKISLFSKTL